MHRTALPIAAAVLALLATCSTAAAASTTMKLLEKQTFQHYTDTGAKGESPGDVRVFGGPLYDLRRHRVGSDRITCIVASNGSRCHAKLVLPRGSVYAQAVVTGPRFTAKLVGGTGAYAYAYAYAHAHGTLTVVSGPLSRYTLRIEGVR